MTTVAFKDGIFACDTQIMQGSNKLGSVQKIFDIDDYVFGFAGTYSGGMNFKKFLEGGDYDKDMQRDEEYSFSAIVWNKKEKRVYNYDWKYLVPEAIDAEFYAIGSGASFAMGAMAAGCSAEKAIEIASQLDANTGSERSLVQDNYSIK